MEEILLDLKNVRKQYANFSLECSMQVKRGSITGLIGANGAGKTTIFKASLGLIHTDGGEIRMMGKTPQQQTVKTKNGKRSEWYFPMRPFRIF